MARLTFEEFEKQYQPLPSKTLASLETTDGLIHQPDYHFEKTGGDAVRGTAVDHHHVWTLGDDDVIRAGHHVVNSHAYLITKSPWADKRIEVDDGGQKCISEEL